MQIEAKEVVFHFNTASIKDPSIPAWVIKCKGETHYIRHLTANCPWSTKETPDNPSTKGSIRFKNCSIIINEQLEATITKN